MRRPQRAHDNPAGARTRQLHAEASRREDPHLEVAARGRAQAGNPALASWTASPCASNACTTRAVTSRSHGCEPRSPRIRHWRGL